MSYREIRVKLPTFIYFHDLRTHIEGEVLRLCSHTGNPCGCWGQGKLFCWGQDLPAARHPLGLTIGPEQLLPHFPATAAGLAECLLCHTSVCWLCALSNVAMPGEGEVGEGQVEMVTSSSMGSGTKD